MKKTLGILLAVCFLLSVTAAAVSAEKVAPVTPKPVPTKSDYKPIKNDDNNKPKHTKGHWCIKKTKHDKDKDHKFVWYTNDKVWCWDD